MVSGRQSIDEGRRRLNAAELDERGPKIVGRKQGGKAFWPRALGASRFAVNI